MSNHTVTRSILAASLKRAYFYQREWVRSETPPPYTKPNAFLFRWGKSNHQDYDAWTQNQCFGGGLILSPWAKLEADLKAYQDIRDQWSDFRGNAQIGTSIAEYNEAFGSVAKRAGTIFQVVKGLSRFRFGDVAKALNVAYELKGKQKFTPGRIKRLRRPIPTSKYVYTRKNERVWLKPAKGSANAWLEYWLCWAPMVGDIHSAVDILQKPPRDELTIKGRGRSTYGWSYPHSTASFKLYSQSVATVSVANPNLELAHRMGLTDPLSIAWEVVPLSFVVNWFIPIDKFLASFQDYLGCNIGPKYTTYFAKCENINIPSPTEVYTLTGGATQRIPLHFPSGPTFKSLTVSMPKLSHTRAATAVSLLTGYLKTFHN